MEETQYIEVRSPGILSWKGRDYRCALGMDGVRDDKAEGDGATPSGCFFLRRVFYRPDRISKPQTRLPVRPISPGDGWCDDSSHSSYNRLIALTPERTFGARFEALWRDDHLYDLVVEIGHNDDPPKPGMGSAVFIHLAKENYSPTAGCVALALEDLQEILKDCDTATAVRIHQN